MEADRCREVADAVEDFAAAAAAFFSLKILLNFFFFVASSPNIILKGGEDAEYALLAPLFPDLIVLPLSSS